MDTKKFIWNKYTKIGLTVGMAFGIYWALSEKQGLRAAFGKAVYLGAGGVLGGIVGNAIATTKNK
jgi:hypothetical protein